MHRIATNDNRILFMRLDFYPKVGILFNIICKLNWIKLFLCVFYEIVCKKVEESISRCSCLHCSLPIRQALQCSRIYTISMGWWLYTRILLLIISILIRKVRYWRWRIFPHSMGLSRSRMSFPILFSRYCLHWSLAETERICLPIITSVYLYALRLSFPDMRDCKKEKNCK